jgi:hypothetical protein
MHIGHHIKTLRLLLAAVLLLAVVTASQGTAFAGTARSTSFKVITANEDRFVNYDFTEKNAVRNKVDWPVVFVFRNNAEIDKVKNKLKSQMKHTGGSMNFMFNGGGGWKWDTDKGIKTGICSFPFIKAVTYHMRLYADGNDRFLNRQWGNYILGTAHIDHNECYFTDRWFGNSETAEGNIAKFAGKAWPGKVRQDYWNLHNVEPTRKEGNHRWENNGYATEVRVP